MHEQTERKGRIRSGVRLGAIVFLIGYVALTFFDETLTGRQMLVRIFVAAAIWLIVFMVAEAIQTFRK